MALICDIRVNFAGVGRIQMLRIAGGVGEMNTYRVDAWTLPHPTTGKELDVKSIEVQHHYDDSPIALVEKACAAIRESQAT